MERTDTTVDDLELASSNADKAYAAGDWPAAVAGYEILIQRHPNKGEVSRKLARAYEGLGRFDDAVRVLSDPGVALDPKSKRVLAITHMKAKDYRAAKPLIDELISTSPDDPKLVAWKALCDASASKDRRRELLREGDALLAAERLDEAEAIYLDLIASFPDTAGAHLRLGQIYTSQQRWPEAKRSLRASLAIEPENEKVRKRLAQTLFKEGEVLFAAERLDEAEAIYLDLVAAFPDTARAHLRLGQIYTSQQRWPEAMRSLRASLAIEPENEKVRKRLAQTLFSAGEPAEAIQVLERGRGKIEDSYGLFLLQRCHMRLGQWAKVDEVGLHSLAIVPESDPLREQIAHLREEALVELETGEADAILEAGDTACAIDTYRVIAKRYPNSAAALLKLGMALAAAEQNDEAVSVLRQALILRPGHSKTLKALTRAVVKCEDEQEVLRFVQDAIAEGTADFECLRWLALYHNRKHDWGRALESARNALEINPAYSSIRLLAARALMRLSRLSEALDEVNILLLQGARSAEALELKADICVRLARLDEAISLYRSAMRADPHRPLLGHRLSYALLLKGDIAGFHAHHERRRETGTFINSNKAYPFLDWNGELEIDGKLLVWSEFGLGVGQNILHMAFLKPLVALGLDVVFEVEPRLVEICRRSFPDIEVIASDAELPAGVSHHTPIGSLSRWFKPDLESFETMRPYFMPDAEAVSAHRERLQRLAGEGQLLVGISWTSNNPFVGDVKSIQLDQLLQAISQPGLTLVNLQYGDHSQSIAAAQEKTGKRLMDSGIDNSNDLDGLAALVAAMDLVVCIGHTTAHMAGAIGTPNFVLLPAGPFAHWLAQGDQCIWYPETTLFRQAATDDVWREVLGEVGQAVRDFASEYDRDSWLSATLIKGLQSSDVRAGRMSPRDLRDAIRSFASQGAYRSALSLYERLPASDRTRELEIQRADMLALIGLWAEARTAYRDLQPAHAPDREIEAKILSVSLDMYDLEGALPIARSLADEDPAFRMILVIILYRLRQYEGALAELRRVSLDAPQTDEVGTLLGTILLERGEAKRAEAYLTVHGPISRRTADYTLLGRSISAQGRSQEALAAFDRALELSRKTPDPAASFWRTQERITLAEVERAPLPPLLGQTPKASPEDLVVYLAADSTYFWEHGLVLLGSLGRHSPNAKCHVHVVNPDLGVPQAIEVIRRLLPALQLSYSFEHIDFEGCTDDHVRTYYASVRFVRLSEIFAQAPATYLCLDADGIIRHDLSGKQSELADGDVIVRMRFDERSQMGMVASASVLRPTKGAGKFIDRVSELIKSTLEAREAVWFLDQVVLNHVLRELGDHQVAVTQLDMTYLDWFFHEDSLIWTGKGRRKSDDNLYVQEVSNYRYLQHNDEISALMPKTDDSFEAAA